MQTFLPYDDFRRTAKVLDVKRLGKQRVEVLQILKVLSIGMFFCKCCNIKCSNNYCLSCLKKVKITPWYNHPAVKMWKGHSNALFEYLKEICNEWTSRGYIDTCLNKGEQYVNCVNELSYPDWLGSKNFHDSHKSALLYKNFEYYSKFNWNVNPCLNYIWPN